MIKICYECLERVTQNPLYEGFFFFNLNIKKYDKSNIKNFFYSKSILVFTPSWEDKHFFSFILAFDVNNKRNQLKINGIKVYSSKY